jgi:hypothetical protein
MNDQGNTATTGTIQGGVRINNVHWHAPTQDEVTQVGEVFTPCLVSIEDEASGAAWLDNLTGVSITDSSIFQNKNLNGDPSATDPLVVCEHDLSSGSPWDVSDDADIYDKDQPPILLRNMQQGLPAPDQPHAYIAWADRKTCAAGDSFVEAYYDADNATCASITTGSSTNKVVCACEAGGLVNAY